MENNGCYILLIDNWCDNSVRANSAELSHQGIFFVNELYEISDEMLEKTHTLFVMESFMNCSVAVSVLKFYKELLTLDIIYLGNNKEHFPMVASVCKVYPCDVNELSLNLLIGAAYDDDTLKTDKFSSDYFAQSKIVADELIHSSTSGIVRKLASDFLRLNDARLFYEQKYTQLEASQKQLISSNERLTSENQKLAKGYKRILADSIALNDTLRDYEGILSKELYRKVNLSDYPERPLIIYFKEFEELLGFELFISTLYDVFRMQNKNSVKALMLFDSYTSRRMHVLPQSFIKLYNSYTAKQVILNDFIAKSGDSSGILDLLMQNREGLNVLLIFDCKSLPDTIVTGQFLQFNVCRDSEHLEAFNLVEDNTVVNGHSGLHYLEFDPDMYSEELKEFKTPAEKFIYLSSQPIYQRILSLTKLYKDRL